ncbi:MAG: polysaccharide biosynthesis tyrosine autokinase [Bacteroidales bacterium]|nr:polysaccharide biosynthesis tyrosine autokinase [Bacteroidales bacterium]
MQNTQTQYKSQNNDDQGADIKNLIYICLSHWYLFVAGALIALAIGFFINRYTTNIYQVTGTVLVKEDKNSFDPTSIMTGISYGNMQNLENEMAILRSYSLCERVVKKMDLEVSYFEKGRVATTEMYKTAPFTVEFDRSVPQTVGLVYEVSILSDGKIGLKAQSEYHKTFDFILCETLISQPSLIETKGEYAQGEWIDNGYNRIRIVLNERYNEKTDKSRKMMFVINDYPTLVKSMSSYSVNATSKQSSIASVVMTGTNRQKIVEFTNLLLSEYVTRGLEKKNQVSENTINFIDKELSGIQDSLNTAEIDLQDFRTSNDLMNLDAQAQQVFVNLKALEKERAEMDVNLKLYQRLQSYIQMQIDDPENLAAPSTMGINDPLLNKLVVDLVTLSQTKAAQVVTLTEQHPTIIKMDEQIITYKKTLLESASNLVSNARMSIAEIDKRIAKAEMESRNMPHKQRLLLGYQRKFELNQNTYNYLMQRRAEAQILRASNTPDNEIIDEARIDRTVRVAPRSSMNYLIALILGLLIPALYLFLKDFFNTTIKDRKDVEKLSNFPIVGQIIESNDKDPMVVINSPKSSISESFRSVRTNVEYITQSKPKCVILVTGDSQGVGKTFNSINTASIYALYGKKTILLGFDMRKPKLFQEFGLNNNVGLSTFLSNKDNLDDIIQASGKISNLDIITSGPIPPNPSELIASEKCATLFEQLKERYDYIIIDTPPLGLVTDAFLLMRHSDVNLYVVRQGITNKNIFGSIIKDMEDRGIKANIILNGIKQEGGYGYRYGSYKYGYSYAYSYGYGRYGKTYGGGYYGSNYYGEESGDKKHKKRK